MTKNLSDGRHVTELLLVSGIAPPEGSLNCNNTDLWSIDLSVVMLISRTLTELEVPDPF